MFNFSNKKFIARLAGFFSVAVILVGVSLFQSSGESKGLEVNFFDVGQGDSILIKTPDHQRILVDGGPDNKVITKLGENLPFYVKDIDLMILTHPHADHLTGLIEVLKRYKVKKVLSTGVLHTTDEYINWLEEIKKQNIPMEIAKAGETITFGDKIKIEILNPTEDLAGKEADSLNNTSVVFKIIFDKTSFLFTGDAEKEVEDKLIGSADLKADVLKVAHHGSKNSTSQEFLDKVKPQIAVISVGAKNTFGHPSKITLERLESIGAEILRTDKDGDVKILSDGNKLEIRN
jgi:competence protein ComEC